MIQLRHTCFAFLGVLSLWSLEACRKSRSSIEVQLPQGQAAHWHRDPEAPKVPHPAGFKARLNEDNYLSGTELYALHCQGCHGILTDSSKKGADSQRISASLTQIPAMQGIQLSSGEIKAIALALG